MKGESKQFATRHSHIESYDGDGAICVLPEGQCEEWALMRGECKPGDVKLDPHGLSKDAFVCSIRGGHFKSLGEGLGGSCLLPNNGGREYLTVDSKGKVLQCNCDPHHDARCWKQKDGETALQRRQARGQGSLPASFGANVDAACLPPHQEL